MRFLSAPGAPQLGGSVPVRLLSLSHLRWQREMGAQAKCEQSGDKVHVQDNWPAPQQTVTESCSTRLDFCKSMFHCAHMRHTFGKAPGRPQLAGSVPAMLLFSSALLEEEGVHHQAVWGRAGH